MGLSDMSGLTTARRLLGPALVLLVLVLVVACVDDRPRISGAARQRASDLATFPVTELTFPGKRLLSESVDPGRKDGGTSQNVGDDVQVTRFYRHSGTRVPCVPRSISN